MRPPVSICTLAYREEDLLRRCLESVAWADERVVLVDAKSTGGSEAIARAAGARVSRHPYDGDIEQKRRCIELATHDWVFVVDADERVSAPLAQEIERVLGDDGGRYDGYEVDRVTFHLGRWIRHGDFHPDWKLRLFRRSKARWVGVNPHGRIEVEGPSRRLRGDLEHYSYRDLADQLDRIQFFSAVAAREMRACGRRARLADLVLRPPARFLRAYLLKAGFRDGVPGLVVAAATAFHVFLKYAKLWELERLVPGEAVPQTDPLRGQAARVDGAP